MYNLSTKYVRKTTQPRKTLIDKNLTVSKSYGYEIKKCGFKNRTKVLRPNKKVWLRIVNFKINTPNHKHKDNATIVRL